jgi:hypothetical protein
MDAQNTICPAFQLLHFCYESLATEKNKSATEVSWEYQAT